MNSFRSLPSKDTSLRIRPDRKRLWKRPLNGKCLNRVPTTNDASETTFFRSCRVIKEREMREKLKKEKEEVCGPHHYRHSARV